jgi:hypothetical protein
MVRTRSRRCSRRPSSSITDCADSPLCAGSADAADVSIVAPLTATDSELKHLDANSLALTVHAAASE